MGIFSSCIQYVLDNEGGYTDDPNDSGGPTNFGITQDDLSRWIARPASVDDIKQLSLKVAEQIYFKWYWSPLGLNFINNNAICTCIFDTGVNEGLVFAARFAQLSANNCGINPLLEVDGQIGDLSEKAINNCDPSEFVNNYASLVKKRYQNIVDGNPSQHVFLNGWLARANRLLTLVSA